MKNFPPYTVFDNNIFKKIQKHSGIICVIFFNIVGTIGRASKAPTPQAEIEEVRKDKNDKYLYRANINELIGVLKDRIV